MIDPFIDVSLIEARAMGHLEGAMKEDWKKYLEETRACVKMETSDKTLPYHTTLN